VNLFEQLYHFVHQEDETETLDFPASAKKIQIVNLISYPSNRFITLKKKNKQKTALSAFFCEHFLISIKSDILAECIPSLKKFKMKEVKEKIKPYSKKDWLNQYKQHGLELNSVSILDVGCPNEIFIHFSNYAVSQIPKLVERAEYEYFLINQAIEKKTPKKALNLDLTFAAFAVKGNHIHFYDPNYGIISITKESLQPFLYTYFSALLKVKQKHTWVSLYC